MTGNQPTGQTRGDISGECSLGAHGYCQGNIDLLVGPGPAVPLLRCACSCHGGRAQRSTRC